MKGQQLNQEVPDVSLHKSKAVVQCKTWTLNLKYWLNSGLFMTALLTFQGNGLTRDTNR